jgi:radical SAM protein with 4Fe4S-binding SPASM domain
LRDEFKARLRETVAEVQAAHPDIALNVLNPDLDPDPRLSHSPGYFSPLLPPNGRIHTCDQSPFESVHILASGQVVVCEVQDEISMGDLSERSLHEIWRGAEYAEFRQKFVTGGDAKCRSCVWKQAYLPSPWTSAIEVGDGMTPQLLRGWHSHEGGPLIWSKKQALVALDNPLRRTRIRLAGVLPPSNSVNVRCNHVAIGECRNPSPDFVSFEDTFSLPRAWDRLYVELAIAHPYRPSLHGSSPDSRDLGIALRRIDLLESE